jgi:hypothetical protein
MAHQKIRLKVSGKNFDLDLEEDFSKYLYRDLAQNLNKENISVKDLLNAYIRKNYEMFALHKRVEELDEKLT